MLRRSSPVWLLFAFLPLLGCGESAGRGGYTIEGTVTKGGQPYTPPSGEAISISLTSGGNSGKSFGSSPDPTGKFKIDHVEAGSYNVSVTFYTEANTADSKKSKPPVTKLSGILWDVTANKTSFTLDLDKVK